jgi:ubiquinone/menaquinone biosynthesis C-methylase UbiE
MPGRSDPVYALGHDERELERLTLQARYWADFTREVFRRAGIGPGMRVLDLGCGAGDVALAAGELVGPTGSVLGLDRSPESVAWATERARAAGAAHVRFAVADLHDVREPGPFDAVVGRFVLMYFSDPGGVLRRLVPLLRPGAAVAFLELHMGARCLPPIPETDAAFRWVYDTIDRSGAAVDMGPRLWQVFRAAGLPDPEMALHQKVEPPPASAGVRYLVETIRSLLPMMERLGVATAAEIDVETLAPRLEQALLAAQSTFLSPRVVAAWARLPG